VTKPPSIKDATPSAEDIESYLKGIGTTPAAFGELSARATYLDKSDALIEIEQALGRLRAQRAQRLNDASLKGKPSEVELYFGLNLGKIRGTIKRQRNRSWDIAFQRLNDLALPASQRFLALEYLLEHIDPHGYTEETPETKLLLDAYRHEPISRELFELYFYAYSQHQLDPENASLARRKAARLLREVDAPEALGFTDLPVREWMSDDENAALERAFDRRYGTATFSDLVMCSE
jgi:hypothetical protein